MERTPLSQRRSLLELKQLTGMLSADEREELLGLPVLVGGADGEAVLVVPGPVDMETWLRLHGGERLLGRDNPWWQHIHGGATGESADPPRS
jgi:hypothetical protein